MKKLLLGAIGALLLGGGVASLASGMFSVGTSAGLCQADDEIPSALRTAAEKEASTFAEAAFGAHPESTLLMMTKEVQSTTSPKDYSAQLAAPLRQYGPFTDVRIARTYLLQASGTSKEARAICGPVSATNWVSVEVKPGLTQAHVMVSAKTRNNDWALTLWLLPEDKEWRVQYVNLSISTVVGYSPDDLLRLAQQQRDAGHMFNAAMLFVGAQAIVERGPAFQLGIAQTIHSEASKFSAPSELQGKPPFVWKMKGAEYKVSGIAVLGIDHKLGLTFDLPLEKWSGNEDANRRNRAFIDAFIATHADYAPTFGFLNARAQKPDGSGGFATVYEAGKGYD